MLPIRMTKLAPSEAINSVAASPEVAEKFRQVKKVGDIQEKAITSATTSMTGSQVPRSTAGTNRSTPPRLREMELAERDMEMPALPRQAALGSMWAIRSCSVGLASGGAGISITTRPRCITRIRLASPISSASSSVIRITPTPASVTPRMWR